MLVSGWTWTSIDFFPPFSSCLWKTLVLTLYRKREIHDPVMMPVQGGEHILFVVVEIPPMEKEKSTSSTESSTEQTKRNIELNQVYLFSNLWTTVSCMLWWQGRKCASSFPGECYAFLACTVRLTHTEQPRAAEQLGKLTLLNHAIPRVCSHWDSIAHKVPSITLPLPFSNTLQNSGAWLNGNIPSTLTLKLSCTLKSMWVLRSHKPGYSLTFSAVIKSNVRTN